MNTIKAGKFYFFIYIHCRDIYRKSRVGVNIHERKIRYYICFFFFLVYSRDREAERKKKRFFFGTKKRIVGPDRAPISTCYRLDILSFRMYYTH